MANKQLKNDEIARIVYIVVMIVFGVLFCCSMSLVTSTLSIVIGIALIIASLAMLITSYLETRSITTMSGFMSAAILAFGILFIVNNLAGIIFSYIPYILIVWGFYMFVDAFLLRFVRHNNSILIFVIELVLGAVAITLGFCLLYVDGFYEYAGLIFGIILILAGVYQLLQLFSKKPRK